MKKVNGENTAFTTFNDNAEMLNDAFENGVFNYPEIPSFNHLFTVVRDTLWEFGPNAAKDAYDGAVAIYEDKYGNIEEYQHLFDRLKEELQNQVDQYFPNWSSMAIGEREKLVDSYNQQFAITPIPMDTWNWVQSMRTRLAEKKANKGLDGMVPNFKPVFLFLETNHHDDGTPYKRLYVRCSYGGEAIAYNGWVLMAHIEHPNKESSVIESVHISESSFRKIQANMQFPFDLHTSLHLATSKGSYCNHCNRHSPRNDSWVIGNPETGEIFQVGRSCMKDFFGNVSPEKLANYTLTLRNYLKEAQYSKPEVKYGMQFNVLEIIATTDQLLTKNRRSKPVPVGAGSNATIFNVTNTLYNVPLARGKHLDRQALYYANYSDDIKDDLCDFLKKHGSDRQKEYANSGLFHASSYVWASNRSSYNKDHVCLEEYVSPEVFHKFAYTRIEPSDASYVYARKVIEFCANNMEITNLFSTNIKNICSAEKTAGKGITYAVWAWHVYKMHEARLREEEERINDKYNFVYTAYDRLKEDGTKPPVLVKCVSNTERSSEYGDTYKIVKFESPASKALLVYMGNAYVSNAEVGKWYILRCTIKELRTYKGEKYHAINYASIEEFTF